MSAGGVRGLREVLERLPPHDPEAVPVELARGALLAAIRPLGRTETVALPDALDRVLAEDVISPVDVPGHDNAAMDGWAIRSGDFGDEAEKRFVRSGVSLAGHPFDGTVRSGQTVRVTTGAMIPEGADAVVVQESARVEGDEVVLPRTRAGQNIRRAGEDVRKGSPALLQGTLLRPSHIGLLASLGIGRVAVSARPRVAFFSTGDELRSLEGPQPVAALEPGQVYDSNRYTMAAMLRRLGCETLDMGVVRDDPAAIEAALRSAAASADVVMTTGGVAEGDADHTRRMMARLGDVAFWKLAMRPGRPFAFGELAGGAFLFGLPGNPVAAMVGFYVLVRPALLAMMGCRRADPPLVPVRAQCSMPKRPGRTEYLRGVLEPGEDGWTVRLTGPQGSGILHSMARADCLVVLDAPRGSVEPGETVPVMVLEGLV